jgi:hypothetical protein
MENSYFISANCLGFIAGLYYTFFDSGSLTFNCCCFLFNQNLFNMKLLFTLLFFIGGLTTFAQNTLDGNWKGTRETPNGTFEINYTFKVEGNELKGTWKTQFGEAKLEKGKVDGKKFSFSISFNDMTINNNGELINDNEIVIKNERGEMKLTRVKS